MPLKTSHTSISMTATTNVVVHLRYATIVQASITREIVSMLLQILLYRDHQQTWNGRTADQENRHEFPDVIFDHEETGTDKSSDFRR